MSSGGTFEVFVAGAGATSKVFGGSSDAWTEATSKIFEVLLEDASARCDI